MRFLFFVSGFLLFSSLLIAGCRSSDAQTDISVQDYTILGDPNAPITLVEYSDYQCPFCRKFATTVLPRIKENYINKGIVRLVYKDFPLSIHEHAIAAAIATHCAGKQGQYYPYHDILFERSKDISDEKLSEWGNEIGLNVDDFQLCRQDVSIRQDVLASIKEARQHGVIGTPSFFVNGRIVYGSQSFAYFERLFAEALGEELRLPEATENAVCVQDSDCGESRTFTGYCSRIHPNERCTTAATPDCVNSGTSESNCVTIIEEECTPCTEGLSCMEGMCVAS